MIDRFGSAHSDRISNRCGHQSKQNETEFVFRKEAATEEQKLSRVVFVRGIDRTTKSWVSKNDRQIVRSKTYIKFKANQTEVKQEHHGAVSQEGVRSDVRQDKTPNQAVAQDIGETVSFTTCF